MLTEIIINLFLKLFQGFISILPSLNFTIPDDIVDTIFNFFSGITYFFPIKALMPIFTFSLAVTGFKILYSLILRVKSFVPGMGG